MSTEAQNPAPEITFTKDDTDAALALLAAVDSPDYALPTLTDEEIVAIDGIRHPQAVALPWLNSHPREHHELICNVALRTLLTKGFVYPVTLEGESEPTRIGAIEAIRGIMALRRLSQRVVIAELTKGANEKVWLYSYLHDRVALQEIVDSAGSHSFSLCRREDVAGIVMELANAAGIESADGEPETLDAEQFEAKAAREFADVRGVTIITAIGAREDDAELYTIYTSPDALHGLEATNVDGAAKLLVARTSRATALAKVTSVVDGAGA